MCPNACSTRTRPMRTAGDDGSARITNVRSTMVHGSTKRHVTKHRISAGVTVMLLLLLVQLQVSIARGNEEPDFTKQCGNCKCSWKSGRKSADCTNQRLPGVPRELSNALQILELSYNEIDELPALTFMSAHYTNLQKLYLRNNGMKRADREAFRNLTILIELDMANNNLSSLEPGIFDDLTKIRVIILNNNRLERIEKNLFRGLAFLTKVHLRSNRLVRIALNSFVNVPILSQIELDYNELQTLRKESFSGLEKLTSLSLTNNPWNCSCALRAFSEFVLAKNLYTSPTACSVPKKLAGRQWGDIDLDEFACPPNIIENRMQFPGGGENATFVCKVTGLPLPTIDWLFQKRPLSLHDQRKLVRQAVRINERDQSEMHVSELTIFGVRQADRGSYVCKATNRGGIDENELFFDLKADPHPIASATRSKDLLWIVLIVLLVLLAIVAALMIWCVCKRVRRKKNSTMSENGLMSAKMMDKSQNDSILDSGSVIVEMQKSLLTEVNPVEKPPRRVDIDAGDKVLAGVGGGGSEYDEKHEAQRTLLDETGFVAQDEETASVALSDSNPRSRATYVDDGCGTNLPPDLLAFPSRFPQSPSIQSSLSNIHDGRIYGKSPLASPIYQMGPGTSSLGGPGGQVPAGFRTLQHPKTGRTIAIAAGRSNSPFTPAPLIYPQVAHKHQGYVTIPRKPRTPSWTPSISSAVTAEMLPSGGSNPASPTSPIDLSLSMCEPVYDNLGLRTTASGNSTLKLNKAHRGVTSGAPNALTSTPLTKYSMKDRPLPATPGGQTATNPLTLGSNYEAIPEKLVPPGGLGLPGLDLDQSSIYGMAPGVGTMNRSKVPPRPPPKPKKKPIVAGDDPSVSGTVSGPMTLMAANTSSTNTSTSPLFADEGDDGTEV
ncbi:leucine-rich repeat-containing protein 24-like [Anopheles ziemanni]|uniref:leucine-rich repeat-containing protein 24-like n=1 Tax=Anopheles coustani TaxID=139045 RepID=UPI0026595E1B|nr:leucine-rich repeat-containing protein 24-like [Anopheles coustani]XP_058175357.1 leucine-rich repeat-containing protein 24-like [Anopheles ziemanni]